MVVLLSPLFLLNDLDKRIERFQSVFYVTIFNGNQQPLLAKPYAETTPVIL